MPDRHDLVIVGMGSCGLTAAEFATRLGLRVAVVERARVGGDCLWTGCVPSKALIASARAADTIRHADRYGLRATEPVIDLAEVWHRIRTVQERIATTDDDPARYTALGIDVVFGAATLTSPTTVLVDGVRSLEARHILVCTGSRPAVPDIAGLADHGFLTSENVFELRQPPRSIAVIGGGPIGVELAQAFARLGVGTTLVHRGVHVLPREERALVTTLEARLRADGVELLTRAEPVGVTRVGSRARLHCTSGRNERTLDVEAVLIATGRVANTDGLGLEALGIEVGKQGIVTDGRGRTSVPTIHAAGDVVGRHLFTHAAAYEGVRAVRDMFFPGRGNVDEQVPWCTFTDPELAHVGLTVAEAENRHGRDVETWRRDFSTSDRARADAATGGSLVVVTAKGKLVGAHILAPTAGEMIHEFALAISRGMKFADLAGLIHVYPTYSTTIAQLASEPAYDRARRFRWLIRR